MTRRNPPPNGIDSTRPNVARIYDYLLGGKDNFAADREAARQLLAVTPDMAGIVRDNRSFIGRVVRYLVWRRAATWPSATAPPAPPKMTPTTSSAA